MARITHVKAAEQRYETVPVLLEDGTPKMTPVMRNGEQRTTKKGKPIFMAVTKKDKTKPLPNRHCEKCSVEIVPGMPYKHVSPKSGPYGGRKRVRCATCPTWMPSELSSSKMSGVYAAQEQLDAEIDNCEEVSDLEALRDDIADQVESVGEEYEESAQNIEDGFGHETSMSSELREKGEELKNWADEIRNVSFDEYEGEEEEIDCTTCDGTGKVENEETETEDECEDCDGTGKVENDEHEEARSEWIEEQRTRLQDVAQDCPV